MNDHIPFEYVIWSAEKCAAYLEIEPSTFLKKTRYLPGFPNPRPIPGHPRWRAIDVVTWAAGTPESRQTSATT